MMKKIKIILKKVGEEPRIAYIPNTLEAMQELVGGYIETVTLASDFIVVCNEEGRLIGLPNNCFIA